MNNNNKNNNNNNNNNNNKTNFRKSPIVCYKTICVAGRFK